MNRTVIFFQRGEYESMHQGLSIAATAIALGSAVELYFFWFALERLVRGPLEPSDLREDVEANLEKHQMPTLQQLLKTIRSSGKAKLAACTGSMAALGMLPPDIEPHVDQVAGLTSIMVETSSVSNRWFC